jgi:hypothetical protein
MLFGKYMVILEVLSFFVIALTVHRIHIGIRLFIKIRIYHLEKWMCYVLLFVILDSE